ncbi:MAG TPA: copper resistance CopC family protein, partial [Ktedonobacterales bacterium]
MGNQRHLARLSGWPRWLMRAGVALGLLLALALAMTPASAHALPIKMSPAPHEVLRTPPGKVTITFSEALNPAAATIRVTDTTSRRVDYSDTEVADDHHTASVSLQLLKPGSYIVVWRMQSADDGHVSTGNYFFQIANLDGTVPPPPSQNPGQSSDSGAQIDGPTWLETIATFVALLALTLWAGGQIWETWVLNPAGEPDPTLHAAAQAANARFRRLGDLALAVLLIANIVVVLAQAASIAGEWGGAFAAPTLRAVLFGGRFGQLWWARQLVALAALYLPFLAERLRWT